MKDKATYTWVLVQYRSTDETGKKAVELAQAGIGYHIINKDRAKNEDVTLAFKFANVKPIPHHLTAASPEQVRKLEQRDQDRKGAPKQEDNRPSRVSAPAKVDFRKVFDKSYGYRSQGNYTS